jgi:small subunit ribosomal protein S20
VAACPPPLSFSATRADPRAGTGEFQGTPMANTSSSRKATRKIARRSTINRDRKSRMKTYLRKVEEAIASGDKKAAATALAAAQPVIMRSASKGVVHKNAASRKVSRLAARVKKLG